MSNKKLFYSDQKGGVSVSSFIFYFASFLIMLSIPVTIYLLNFPNQNLQSSASVVDFKSSPSVELAVDPVQVKTGEMVKVSVKPENGNFYRVFYSKFYTDEVGHYMSQLSTLDEIPTSVALIIEGMRAKEETFTPPTTGYIFAVVYQLHNKISDFKSGDIMCGWDSSLYIYKKHKDSLFSEIISDLRQEKPTNLGAWEKLAVCNNPGGVKVDVTQ